MPATPNADSEQSTRSASSISRVLKASPRAGASGSREIEPRIADLARSPKVAVRDVISGSISALVTISYSLSFAAMIFSGPLKGNLEDGVRMSLMSAGLTLIVITHDHEVSRRARRVVTMRDGVLVDPTLADA